MEETWKTIPFAADYAVSDHGRVKRLAQSNGTQSGRVLKQKLCGTGRQRYLGLALQVDKQEKHFRTHRLVALAFLGDPPTPNHQVAHNDGDTHNNRLCNLRWATRTENANDKRLHGTMAVGEAHGQSKLSEGDVRAIRTSAETGVALARKYGVAQATISSVRLRQDWSWLS